MFAGKIGYQISLLTPIATRIIGKFLHFKENNIFTYRTFITNKRMDSTSGMSSSPSQEVIDKVVNDWVDVTRIPIISGGHFVEDKNFLKISSTWSVMDFAKKENVSFQRQFSVLKSSLVWAEGQDALDANQLLMTATEAVPIDGKKICISSCATRKAVLVEKVDKSSGQKTQILEIWNEQTLLKSYDLGELDMHKNVYTSGFFGTTMVWDKSAQKLAYLAEKKVAKAKPFFSSNVKVTKAAQDNADDKKKADLKGEEYAFRQTWGEQLQDMYFSVIVVLDVSADKFELIELSDNDTEFPIDIQWVDNTSIIGTSYAIPPWRLGLYACNNRPSRIFQVGADGKNLKFLSTDGRAAFSPRVRPDGEYVIWQERAVDEPHNRSRDIMGMSTKEPAVPQTLYKSSSTDMPVYVDFPRICWTPNGSSFVMLSIKDGETALFAVSLINDGVKLRTIIDRSPGVRGLLWIGNEYLLVSRSSTLTTPFLELIRYGGDAQIKRAQITNSASTVHNHDQFEVKKLFGKATVPSFYIGPKNKENKTVPLIVMPHGGPHAVTVDAFVDEFSLILRQGFALLKVNYIGSLGSKKDETDALLGKAGKLDVEDCHEIVQLTLKSNPCLDSEQIGLFGGSHGGFLAAHLCGQYPDFYKAAVLLNPVCDLNVMIGTSDIVDWCMAESGIAFPDSNMKTFVPAAKNADEFQKLFEASPIVHASKVKAATLLLLGTEDLRVPMSQGMNFYRALKAYNKTAEVRVYPDCHSLLSPSVANDVAIQSALWFNKFLRN